jgi:circadian clock protein KaiB
MVKKCSLRLYIIGDTDNSRAAIKNLNDILDKEPKDLYKLVVIDVLKNPQAAAKDKILATPTLIRVSPEPVKKIMGDLSDREKVLSGLDLNDKPKRSVNRDENFEVTL